jgi:hypothetical protein
VDNTISVFQWTRCKRIFTKADYDQIPCHLGCAISNDIICRKKAPCLQDSLALNRGSFKLYTALPRGVTRKHPRSASNNTCNCSAESSSHYAEPDYPSVGTTT